MIDNATDASIGVVVADDDPAAASLLAGALASLSESGVETEDIFVSHVPTIGQLPFAARQMAVVKEPSAVVMLGIATGTVDDVQLKSTLRILDNALAQLNIRHDIPFIDGIVRAATPTNADEARRSGGSSATAALQMANMMASLINS